MGERGHLPRKRKERDSVSRILGGILLVLCRAEHSSNDTAVPAGRDIVGGLHRRGEEAHHEARKFSEPIYLDLGGRLFNTIEWYMYKLVT
jgi:hypothetical protein